MTASESLTAVIVGAGHAAGELVTSLREQGWKGRIVLVGEEPQLPYHRPPLSKSYLLGETTAENLLIKPRATYDKAGVEIISGVRAKRVDPQARNISLADGRQLSYDRLVLTTGGRPRPLPVPSAQQAEQAGNFHYLRTQQDADRLRQQFEPGMRLVIIGGGYVGLEVAAAAIRHKLSVTLLEALPRVLARVTAPEISAFYERRHREAGVDIRTNTQVQDVEMDASGDAVAAVRCSDGGRIQADVVVVGIGLLPNVELAQEAGLAVDNGILVDEFGQTSIADIYAAGDCTNHPNPLLGRRLRLESVPNALDQARCVASALCGKPRAHASIPWFWSDQYDLKLKMVGLSEGYDQLVLRGSMEADSFIAFYLQRNRVLAADSVNRPGEFMLAKRLVAEGTVIDPQLLRDETHPLKEFLANA